MDTITIIADKTGVGTGKSYTPSGGRNWIAKGQVKHAAILVKAAIVNRQVICPNTEYTAACRIKDFTAVEWNFATVGNIHIVIIGSTFSLWNFKLTET